MYAIFFVMPIILCFLLAWLQFSQYTHTPTHTRTHPCGVIDADTQLIDIVIKSGLNSRSLAYVVNNEYALDNTRNAMRGLT